MTNKKIKKFINILFIIFVIIGCSKILFEKYFTINLSTSIPAGIYLKLPLDDIKKGDIVIFDMPEDIDKFVHEREYIVKKCHSFIKIVGGIEGDRIEKKDNFLYINNEKIGKISLTDTIGRRLPQIENFKVSKNKFFPIGSHINSFDGRYYGEVEKNLIRNKAKLILEF